jgi:transcriptional regulator with XRE-family HTH domain
MAQRKLSDADLARLRGLADAGWTQRALADKFEISRQHVGRVLRGEQRATLAGLDARAVRSGVLGAVEQFLDGRPADDGDQVLAEAARALASKLDGCAESDSVAAAQAAPRVSAELVAVLDRLRAGGPHVPDAVDRLRMRSEARRLLAATNNPVHHSNWRSA